MTLSLRTALIVSINFTVFVVLCVTGYATYRNTLHELDEMFDAELAQTTRLVKSLIRDADFLDQDGQLTVVEIPTFNDNAAGINDADDGRRDDGHKYESKLGFQVWDGNGQLVLATENALGKALSLPQQGYHEVIRDGNLWMSYSHYDETTQHWIYTAQREDVRSELSQFLANEQLFAVLLTWVPISLVILLLTNILLRPVQRYSEILKTRSAHDLHAITIELPQELQPIADSVNALFARIENYIEREQRFVADASHELRTPLAALKLHAAQLAHQDEASVKAIKSAVDRMSHLVNQLLELARLENPTQLQQPRQPLKLAELTYIVLADLPGDLVERVTWKIDIDEQFTLTGYPVLFGVLLRNLLHNAATHATENGIVSATAELNQEQLIIRIADDGAGVPEDELEHLSERFYRSNESRQYAGSGLGLSIVQRIAELHHGQVQFSHNQPHGLVVILRFPISCPPISSPAQVT